MPYFPITFPYTFGEQPVGSQTLAVTAAPSAGAAVEKYADGSLAVVLSGSGTPQKDVTVAAILELTAADTGSSTSKTIHAAAALGVDASGSTDSQESGYADTSFGIIATPDAVVSLGQFISAQADISASTGDVAAHRAALLSALLDVEALNTGYYGGPGVIVPNKFESLVDNFNSKNTAIWSGWTGGTSVSEGVLVMPLSSGGSSIYTTTGDINTGSHIYDLTDSYVVIHLVQPPNTDDSTPSCRVEVKANYSTLDGSNLSALRVEYVAGVWRFRQIDQSGNPGAVTTASYASSGPWIRIRVSNGMAYWDTSLNGVGWAVAHEEQLAGEGFFASSVTISADPGVSADPGTAIWDQFNSVPRPIQAFLSVSAVPSTVVSRGQNIYSNLVTEVFTESGEGRYDAFAQASLTVTSLIYADILRSIYAAAESAVMLEMLAEGTEFDTAESPTTEVVASVSASSVLDQIFSTLLQAQVSQFAAAMMTQYTGSDLSFYADPFAAAKVRYPVAAHLAAYAFPTAIMMRNARASGSLGVTLGQEVIGTEYGIADTSFHITASPSATMSRLQLIEAFTAASITKYAVAINVFYGAADLHANAWHTVTADEPGASVSVKPDVRTVAVPNGGRVAGVSADNRKVVITSAIRKAKG